MIELPIIFLDEECAEKDRLGIDYEIDTGGTENMMFPPEHCVFGPTDVGGKPCTRIYCSGYEFITPIPYKDLKRALAK